MNHSSKMILIQRYPQYREYSIEEIYKERRIGEVKFSQANIKLAKKELGWKPKTTFIKGLEKTTDWYLENKSYYSLLRKKDIIRRIGLRKWLKKE